MNILSIISFEATSILYRFGAFIEKYMPNLNDRGGRIVNKIHIYSKIIGSLMDP